MLAAALVVVGVYVCLVVFASAWLNGQAWFGASANLIQHLSGPATFAAVIVGGWAWWHGRCATPLCIRRGQHPVTGTTKKVCHHHHSHEHHLAVQAIHQIEGRLGWGESSGAQHGDANREHDQRGSE
jgi:hypothetical protein